MPHAMVPDTNVTQRLDARPTTADDELSQVAARNLAVASRHVAAETAWRLAEARLRAFQPGLSEAEVQAEVQAEVRTQFRRASR